jgi:hypothetical protein
MKSGAKCLAVNWLRGGLSLCRTLALVMGSMTAAHAGLVECPRLANWTLLNTNADGCAVQTPAGIRITGGSTGSGEPGTTDLFTTAMANGPVHFDFTYSSLDLPTLDYAAYFMGGNFIFIADSDASGSLEFPVTEGQTFGFRVGTADNQFEPGILLISNLTVPIPEPGTFPLTMIAIGAALALQACGAVRRGVRIVALGIALAGTSCLLAQSQMHYTGTNVTGQFVRVGQVDLRQQAQVLHMLETSMAGPEFNRRAPRARLYPRFARQGRAAERSPSINAQSIPVSGTPAALGFDGITHYDHRNANGGNQYSIEPPSPVVAAANGYVVEAVNSAFQVYSDAGVPLLPAVLATNQVFGLAPAYDRAADVAGPNLTDVRVFWDRDIQRWFVLQRMLANDAAGNLVAQSAIYLAVSQTADPTATYTIYSIDTTDWSRPGCPCFSDYPQIGADQYGLYISANQFNVYYGSYGYADASILALSKAALASGDAAPAAYEFVIPLGTGYGFTIQPATTPAGASYFVASGGLEYFVSSRLGTSGSSLAVWAMANTSSLASGNPNLSLTQTVIPSLSYQTPPMVWQRPGPYPYGSSMGMPLEPVDGGDTRVQSVSYAGGRLYVTLATLAIDEDENRVVGAAYFVVSPAFRGNLLAASALRQGYVVVRNNNVLRPAIAVDAQGRGAIVFTLMGPGYYPSAAFIPFAAFSPGSAVRVAGFGAAPEDGFTGYDYNTFARWGDYSCAVVGTDGSIWMATEYIPNAPRTEYANWGTYLIRYTPQ